MDERIKEHLKRLNQYRLHLVDIRDRLFEEFKREKINGRWSFVTGMNNFIRTTIRSYVLCQMP